jgi:hypothetical protein
MKIWLSAPASVPDLTKTEIAQKILAGLGNQFSEVTITNKVSIYTVHSSDARDDSVSFLASVLDRHIAATPTANSIFDSSDLVVFFMHNEFEANMPLGCATEYDKANGTKPIRLAYCTKHTDELRLYEAAIVGSSELNATRIIRGGSREPWSAVRAHETSRARMVQDAITVAPSNTLQAFDNQSRLLLLISR